MRMVLRAQLRGLASSLRFFRAFAGPWLQSMASVAMSTGAGAALVRFHSDKIRLPMMGVALIGSLLNLAIFMHVRHLRNRPASQWRQKPLSLHKLRMERVQLILSLATLVLIGIEEYLHFGFHHSV
jgi:hypothetical protein